MPTYKCGAVIHDSPSGIFEVTQHYSDIKRELVGYRKPAQTVPLPEDEGEPDFNKEFNKSEAVFSHTAAKAFWQNNRAIICFFLLLSTGRKLREDICVCSSVCQLLYEDALYKLHRDCIYIQVAYNL